LPFGSSTSSRRSGKSCWRVARGDLGAIRLILENVSEIDPRALAELLSLNSRMR
jgi:hypothetical protein